MGGVDEVTGSEGDCADLGDAQPAERHVSVTSPTTIVRTRSSSTGCFTPFYGAEAALVCGVLLPAVTLGPTKF